MKKALLTIVSCIAAWSAFSQLPSVAFTSDFKVISEDAGEVIVSVAISAAPATEASVLVSLSAYATAEEGADFLFEDFTMNFINGGNLTQTIAIPVSDNDVEDIDKLFALKISNPVNCTLGSKKDFVVYLLDDEETLPVGANALGMEYRSSYLVDAEGSAEIVAFNKPNKRLYVMNSTASAVQILDFSDPFNITPINQVDLTAFGPAATSVACNNAVVAATVDGEEGQPGSVVFMNKNGVILSSVQVGFLPDMLVFTPDNQYVLVANEGEPTDEYTFDPEGSISVIDISGNIGNLSQDDVTTLDFSAFNGQEDFLRAQGIRIFGLNANAARDFEPEYITVSDDSQKAWVTLQENNAVAVIDLEEMEITDVLPLGLKDHRLAGNAIDVSDRNDSIHLSTWNIRGMYMPDAIASYEVNGVTYLVTANEGDQREYGVIDEDVTVRSSSYVLDPATFPEASLLKLNHMLGRLAVTPYSGDTDNDGDFDEIHAFGSRSFSIWNSETGALVYDSGDDFERITANDPVFGALFNASNSNNSFKNRSDNKGPEPEGVTVAEIGDKVYSFITLERTGGLMAYEVTNPAQPVFDAYLNSRSLLEVGGDLGPEGIIYISAQDSPVDTALVVIANEISATLSVYSLNNVVKRKGPRGNNRSAEEDMAVSVEHTDFTLYPNPVEKDVVYFSQPASVTVYDLTGKQMMKTALTASLDVSHLDAGIYFVVTTEGQTTRMVIR